MSFNFPNTPAMNELFPPTPVAGVPQYQWNGFEWVTPAYNPLNYVLKSGDTMLGALNVVTPPTAAAHAASKSYVDTYAAPLDALSYSGMQVNGSMEIGQEKGANGTTVNNTYVSDGWKVIASGIVFNSAQDNAVPVPGFVGRLFMNATTAAPSLGANDYLMLRQSIEGYRVSRLGWGTASAQPITIGFWSEHTTAGVYSVSINNNGSTRSYATTYTQNVGAQREYKTVTIPGDTSGTWLKDNNAGIIINFVSACGTNLTAPSVNSWQAGNYIAAPGQVNNAATTSSYLILRGVAILPGIYAPTAAQSPLIMRSFDQELVTCRRYYTRTVGGVDALTQVGYSYGAQVSFDVPMRAAPTVARTSDNVIACFGTPTSKSVTTYGFIAHAVANISGSGSFSTNYTADARL